MDERSHGYEYREGGNDVERTLMMVASGVVNSPKSMAEVWIHIVKAMTDLCLIMLCKGFAD